MMFCDDTTGFIAVWNHPVNILDVHRTTDGGDSWTNIFSFVDIWYFSEFSMYFFDGTYGYVSFNLFGNFSNVCKYVNGVKKWIYESYELLFYEDHLYFLNDSTGFQFCEHIGTGQDQMIKSSDSCANWHCVQDSLTDAKNDLYFASETVGIAVGDDGMIFRTPDAGDSWQLVSPVTSKDLNSVHFINGTTGYIVGDNGTFLNTSDGGESWESVGFNYSSHLVHIQYVNDTVGFVLDMGGNLYMNGVVSSISGIPDDLEVRLYPNPAKDVVKIVLLHEIKEFQIDIYDSRGFQVVGLKNETVVDVSDFACGLYFVEVRSGEFSHVQKLVIR
jgi:hypothetical protein